MNFKCKECGNESLFYHNVSVEAKQVFNQKTGKEYIRDKSDSVDNFFPSVHCYKCGFTVREHTD